MTPAHSGPPQVCQSRVRMALLVAAERAVDKSSASVSALSGPKGTFEPSATSRRCWGRRECVRLSRDSPGRHAWSPTRKHPREQVLYVGSLDS